MKKLFLIALLSVGCKQGEGERCQVNDDCSSPLTCNQAKMQCQSSVTGNEDAEITDAPPPGTDAAISDAPADAPADATSLPDAPND